ncbi:unnamed protein product [Penicillium egyptiacum]|uniref:Major facilitator superfamily (MFS) profile domain-containing protein n=1 Tax=Penicillium egyptiacum TaxID=1303716 RepID=A0A9W4KL92_9EURO|nr:unnamed protein product [Penicillium egyptiacum]
MAIDKKKHSRSPILDEFSPALSDCSGMHTTPSWNGQDDPENPFNWPVSRKWALTCLAAFTTFLTMMNGTIITVAHFEISEIFSVTEATSPNSYWPVTTWACGGACSALLILPLAEDFGTRPVFLSTYSILLCFLVPQAVAQNFATLVVTRFFAGGCVAILANTAAGVVGNLWETEWSRSIPVSLYIFGYMSGSSMGPVMGAAIYQSLGWRWVSYMQLIWVDKTASPGDEHKKINFGSLITSATRPVILVFTEPVLFVSTMWSAFTVGVLFIFTQSVELGFMELYDWDVSATGYVQCSIVIGECIGWFLNFISRSLYFASASRNKEFPGKPIPEARLCMAILGGVFGLSGGMFTYAWTSNTDLPWIAPAIGLGLVGAGSVLVVTGVSDYVVDAYSQYASSAMGAVATGENLFSAFLPLATLRMYTSLGVQWASTLLAFISLVLSLVPTLMFVWGKEVRARSPFMNEMTKDTTMESAEVV